MFVQLPETELGIQPTPDSRRSVRSATRSWAVPCRAHNTIYDPEG